MAVEPEGDDLSFPKRLEGEGIDHGSITDNSSPSTILLRNTLVAWHWAGYKRMMDMVQLACSTDRQYAIMRHQIMDLTHEQERAMKAILYRLLPKEGGKAEGPMFKEKKA